MSASIAQQINAALKARAALIRTASGYQTDAGRTAYLGQPAVDLADLPCVVVRPEALDLVERMLSAGAPARWARQVTVEAFADADPLQDPGETAEALLADLQTALLAGDETLGGLAQLITFEGGRVLPREDGSRVAGAAVTLRIEFWAGYGAPATGET
jgi:hypothetical protein